MPNSADPDGRSPSPLVPYERLRSLATRGLALADEVDVGEGKIRVLVVDDIAETRFNLARLLSFETDMEVVALAGDGKEGVLLVQVVQPDVVLMDVCMPVMDGITATEIIAVGPDAPALIVMSVQREEDYDRRSRLAGAKDYLVKPFSAVALVEAIRRVYDPGRSPKPRHDAQEIETDQTHVRPDDLWPSDGAPFNVLPGEGELPPGFRIWGGGGPWKDLEPIDGQESKHWNYVFVRGSRPATTSPFISLHLIVAASADIAREKFEREVAHPRWTLGSPPPEPATHRRLARWPQASEFSEPRELPISYGDAARAFEAVFSGRVTVWAYVRIDKALVGIQAQDVSADVVIDQVRRMVLKVPEQKRRDEIA